MIGRQVERMLRLVHDLLDWASLDAGRLALDKAPHEVAEIVRGALDAHRRDAESKTIELVAELEGDGRYRIDCDAGSIQALDANPEESARVRQRRHEETLLTATTTTRFPDESPPS